MATSLYKKQNSSVRYSALSSSNGCEELELVSTFLPKYEKVVERPVREGETLRTIAINYRISVSELKRINRLQNDSEFYALSDIKIPLKANSMLEEILQEEADQFVSESQLNNSTNSESRTNGRSHLSSFTSNEADDTSDADSCVGYVSIHQILREKSTRKEARRFLENMRADLAKIKDKVVSEKGSLVETAAALNDPRFVPLTQHTSAPESVISWWRLFFGAILILLLLPVAYFIYLFHSQ